MTHEVDDYMTQELRVGVTTVSFMMFVMLTIAVVDWPVAWGLLTGIFVSLITSGIMASGVYLFIKTKPSKLELVFKEYSEYGIRPKLIEEVIHDNLLRVDQMTDAMWRIVQKDTRGGVLDINSCVLAIRTLTHDIINTFKIDPANVQASRVVLEQATTSATNIVENLQRIVQSSNELVDARLEDAAVKALDNIADALRHRQELNTSNNRLELDIAIDISNTLLQSRGTVNV